MEQTLRRLAVKLETSGTATLIENTALYKGAYAFVYLRALVPVTQNRTAGTTPLCTVHGVITDNFGKRVQITDGGTKKYWNMLFVEQTTVNGFDYLIFERLMPKPLTDTVGGLDIVYNYSEVTADGKLSSRLTTNTLHTTVGEGGEADGEIDVAITDSEVAQINANSIAIEVLQDDVQVIDQRTRSELGRIWTSEYLTIADFCANDPKVEQIATNDTVLLSTGQAYMYYAEWDGVAKPPTDPAAYRAEASSSIIPDSNVQSTADLPNIGTTAGIAYDTVIGKVDEELAKVPPLTAGLTAETAARESADTLLQTNLDTEAQTRADADTQQEATSAANLTAAKDYTDTRLTGYLTEQEVYDAITEVGVGVFNDKGSVATRADLPATAPDFDMYHITDENVDVYARNVDGALTWLSVGTNIDLSVYETVAGADEKVAQAQQNAEDFATAGLDGKVDKIAGKGLSTNDLTNPLLLQVQGAYQKPTGGIPETDLETAVRNTLDSVAGKASTASVAAAIVAERSASATLTNKHFEGVGNDADYMYIEELDAITINGYTPDLSPKYIHKIRLYDATVASNARLFLDMINAQSTAMTLAQVMAQLPIDINGYSTTGFVTYGGVKAIVLYSYRSGTNLTLYTDEFGLISLPQASFNVLDTAITRIT